LSATGALDGVTQFIDDLKGRLAHRVQLTSDGYGPFLEAMEAAVGSEIDQVETKPMIDECVL
jgi:hypothetical protein